MIDFAVARRKMIDNQLRTSNITDRRLLAVMSQVPREPFVPLERRELAYIDEAHLLAASSGAHYLAAPAPFARLVQLANVNTDDKVLDVGAGTGYSAAVLASLSAHVVALESDPNLAASARANLAALDIGNVTVVEGAVEDGVKAHGPYDVIVVEGTLAAVPDALLHQLADGGRLVVLLRQNAAVAAYIYVRSGHDVAGRPEFNTSAPALPSAKKASEFVF